MTYRGAIRGLGIGSVARFTGDATRRGGFPADILAAALEVWHFSSGTTPTTVDSDISAWLGKKGAYTLTQGTGARQPTLRSDGVQFVLADNNYMTSAEAGLGDAIIDTSPWTIGFIGTAEDSGAANYGFASWTAPAGAMFAYVMRTSTDKIRTLRAATSNVQHNTTDSVASPFTGVIIGQGAGASLNSGAIGSYVDNVDMAPADASGAILATASTTFTVGAVSSISSPMEGKIVCLIAMEAVLTAAQRTALQAWYAAGAVWG